MSDHNSKTLHVDGSGVVRWLGMAQNHKLNIKGGKMCLSTDKAEKGMGKYEDNDKWVPELGFTYQELAMIHGLKSGFASFTF